MKPKSMRTGLGRGYKTGYLNGYSGISVYLTSPTSAKTQISEIVVVNDPLTNPTQTMSESVLVTVT